MCTAVLKSHLLSLQRRSVVMGTAVLCWASLLSWLVWEHGPPHRTTHSRIASNNHNSLCTRTCHYDVILQGLIPVSVFIACITALMSSVQWPSDAISRGIPCFFNGTPHLLFQTTCNQPSLVHLDTLPICCIWDFHSDGYVRWDPCPHSMAHPWVADGGTASSYGG
jgi:hypothetical protein